MFGGRFSKFQERLRNIRLSRSKKERFSQENQKYIDDKVKEIKKVVREDNTVYRVRRAKGIDHQKDKIIKKKVQVVQEKMPLSEEKSFDDIVNLDNALKKDIDYDSSLEKKDDISFVVSQIEKKKPKLPKKKVIANSFLDDDNQGKEIDKYSSSKKNLELELMEDDLINRLKGQFENYLDEVEVLSSEIYFLKDQNDHEMEFAKVVELKKKIQELILEINKIIEQYNLYGKNSDMNFVIGIEDKILADDIISYRDKLNGMDDQKKFISSYKKLDVFKGLYVKLNEVKDEANQLILENDDKVLDYKQRDKEIFDTMMEIEENTHLLSNCNEEILKQEEYFKRLLLDVGKIDREEYTTYHLKGIGNLLDSSLRYMGLMMLSPFSGFFPMIGIQALATRNLVSAALNQLHYEKREEIHYYAKNYDKEILEKMSDIHYVSDLLSDTLTSVQSLRDDFMMKFSGKSPLYEENLKKILDVEKNILRYQNKVNIIEKKLMHGKALNDDKMMRVKKLNEE